MFSISLDRLLPLPGEAKGLERSIGCRLPGEARPGAQQAVLRRYYWVSISPTLFGEFAMVREWGRIGQRGGSRMECWFASEEEALRAGLEMAAAKRRRGYRARFRCNTLLAMESPLLSWIPRPE